MRYVSTCCHSGMFPGQGASPTIPPTPSNQRSLWGAAEHPPSNTAGGRHRGAAGVHRAPRGRPATRRGHRGRPRAADQRRPGPPGAELGVALTCLLDTIVWDRLDQARPRRRVRRPPEGRPHRSGTSACRTDAGATRPARSPPRREDPRPADRGRRRGGRRAGTALRPRPHRVDHRSRRGLDGRPRFGVIAATS